MNEIYFAVVGDVHGHIYEMIDRVEKKSLSAGINLDFVLQVGDFQPCRDEKDLNTMNLPTKYRQVGDFPDFWNELVAFSWPVWFVGGNHEPYGFLDQYLDGAELVLNCHYWGRANTKTINNMIIAGLSGICQEDRFFTKRPEIVNYGQYSNKDYAYYNQYDFDKIMAAPKPDILLIHDWPETIVKSTHYGNLHAKKLIERIFPQIVFCGHMHLSYENVINFKTKICCLPDVLSRNSVRLFSCSTSKGIQEV